MGKRKKKKKKILTPDDIMKYEIAAELGLTDKIEKEGWGGLTAKESGRIGGIMTARKKKKMQSKQKDGEENNNINTNKL
ncbi:small, acid-soluble spore protein, alpha/beta type [Caldisalinibacter kiritimatiensis]|uniref:Small acid-soluble spore protein beta n=1 Tax=Caldisalinibacter kiritimatiensis TaxID=1304284 RepID=R1CQE8_9FIRM|nr:small, acid-soluble spore protein, alpha/beta type [Caldisalinibacter kiritimatiensis]EOD00896.1 Small acid-soluble spore protein beta [Caldisalinibacter kiritimatiensis]